MNTFVTRKWKILLNFSTSSLVSSYFTFEAEFFDTENNRFRSSFLKRFLSLFQCGSTMHCRLLTFGDNCLKVVDQIVQFAFSHNHGKKTHKYRTSHSQHENSSHVFINGVDFIQNVHNVRSNR